MQINFFDFIFIVENFILNSLNLWHKVSVANLNLLVERQTFLKVRKSHVNLCFINEVLVIWYQFVKLSTWAFYFIDLTMRHLFSNMSSFPVFSFKVFLPLQSDKSCILIVRVKVVILYRYKCNVSFRYFSIYFLLKIIFLKQSVLRLWKFYFTFIFGSLAFDEIFFIQFLILFDLLF